MGIFKRIEINRNTIESSKDFTEIMVMADRLADRLIEKDLGNFLRSDFYIDKSKYPINSSNGESVKKSLQPILDQILGYLKLPLFVKLVINYDNGMFEYNQKFKAGEYRNEWDQRKITVNYNKAYSLDNIIAILCHECSHYFMDYHDLNIMDELYEKRNDIMSCLIGFSNHMANGYKESYVGPYVFKARLKIGYISYQECNEISRYIAYKRSKMDEDLKVKKELTEKKEELRRLLDLADDFIEQLDIIDPLKDKDAYKTKGSAELNELQSAIHEHQNLNTGLLNDLKKALEESNDLKETEEDIRKAEKFLGLLQGINQTYQKYHINR